MSTDFINWKSDEQAKIDKDMKYFKQEIWTGLYRKNLLKWYHFNDNINRTNVTTEERDKAVRYWIWNEL
jgi:hypothetical protein